jgi:hypothetical protein
MSLSFTSCGEPLDVLRLAGALSKHVLVYAAFGPFAQLDTAAPRRCHAALHA